EAQCINCHNGPTFTDGTFHNLGLPPRPHTPDGDTGRWRGIERMRHSDFIATGRHSDAPDSADAKWTRFARRTDETRGQFKTPTLRNVARTPPYMHGPHFDTLEGVVEFYSRLPGTARVGHREEMLEPLGLSERETRDLVAFLRALSGERPPAELLEPPESPVPPGSMRD
ncbi:MAG: cytochrome-c peroxidase, partial [Bradymonadaceae bacterium]